MISVKHKGNFNNIERFFNRMLRRDYLNVLSDYAQRGVEALKNATPVDTGTTASSWGFTIETRDDRTILTFTNDCIENGANVAILLIYGHATKTGSYVEGIDFVSPALAPVFYELADAMWKEVTK